MLSNLYIFFNRNAYQFIKQTGYNELYQPFSGRGIKHISISEKNAIVSLEGYNNEIDWTIKTDSLPTGKPQKQPLVFQLEENLHNYIFTPNDTTIKPIKLILEYSSRKQYFDAGNSSKSNAEIRYSSVPFIKATNKWKYTYDYIPAEEIAASKKILKTDAALKDTDADTVKFKKIALFIYKTLLPHIGVPADSLLAMRPQQQFNCIRNGKAQVWCANFSILLNYFCSISGLKIRQVGFTGRIHNISAGVHIANEIYIPEYGGWVYTDLTQNLVFLKDDAGNYLNAADFLFFKSMSAKPNINAYRIRAENFQFEKLSTPEVLYGWNYSNLVSLYPHDPAKLYSLKNKIKRYLTEEVWFEIYDNGSYNNNKKFYLKQFLFITFVFTLVLAMFNFAIYQIKNK